MKKKLLTFDRKKSANIRIANSRADVLFINFLVAIERLSWLKIIY